MSEEIKTAKDKLNYIDAILDEYETKCGLPICKAPGAEEELDRYLSMDRDEIEKLTPDLCSGILYRLSQYAFYLKRLYNREKSRVIWAKQQLNEIVAKEIDNYDKYTKSDINIAKIANSNSYALSLQKIMTYAEQRSVRLENMADFIKHLSDSMKAIQMTKVQMLRNQ
jgi:hypothetical protein